jgi:hypothetical protein
VPVVFDTPAAATACFNVAPLARAVKNLARTSADFGFLPNAHLHRSQEVRMERRSCNDRLKPPPYSCGVDFVLPVPAAG